MILDPSEQTQQSDYLKRLDVQGHLKVLEMLREWDPIGVDPNNTPGAFDEYDSYSGWVVTMLDRDASADEIAEGLRRLAIDHMGLTRYTGEGLPELMANLKAWWKQWKASLGD